MKTTIKTLIFIVALSLWINSVYSQDEPEFVKIHTPLGHEPVNNKLVLTSTSNEVQVEQSKQAWLYSGGLFKKDSGASTFTEMNNYLSEQRVLCMDIVGENIYIGTENGIYLSTTYGDTWLEQANDGIDNLPGKKINAISVGTNKIFACTDSGLYSSTDSCVSWVQFLNDRVITCIEYGIGDTIYAGVKISYPGVYKSTDYGLTWNRTSLDLQTLCLKYYATHLYAGTESDLNKSTNGGVSWDALYSEDKVSSIYIDSSNIYIGTDIKGSFRSTNGGVSFNTINTGLPNKPSPNQQDYYTLNSLQRFNDELFAATDTGLYKTVLSSISWSDCNVEDDYFRSGTETEKLTNMVFIDNTPNTAQLWVACWGGPKWESASMIRDRAYPLNPPNFPNYLCHTFAWHFSEGGESGVDLLGPNTMRYIPWGADSIGWGKENWDYIQTVWNDTLWDKVTYSWGHSGIKSLKNNPDMSFEDSLIIESKWSDKGPLVEHKLWDCPYSGTIRYWKSKKTVSDTITEDNRIGRQIITEGVTTIPSNDTVEFYVAPMIEHKIHLKPGFHAERGSTFHAFVKDYYIDSGVVKLCKIPWEEDSGKVNLKDDLAENYEIISAPFGNVIQRNTLSCISSATKTKNNNNYFTSVTLACTKEMHPLKFSGNGTGTEEDPFQITTLSNFEEMAGDYEGNHYWILMNDIDASETRYWNPKVNNGDTLYYGGFRRIIADKHRSLDGRGHVIRNLYKFQNSRISLFSDLNCFTIKRLGFEDLLFEGAPTRFLYMGNDEDRDFIMEECYITGKFTGTEVGVYGSSGFGVIDNGAIVRNCYTDLTLISDSIVTNFARTDTADKELKVLNCYAAGKAISPIVNSPFGYGGNVISCFWDNEKILVTEPLGIGLGLSTADMMKRSIYESAGWDFEKVWYIDEGKDYPKLRAFKRDTTDIQEGINNEYFSISPNPASDFIEISVGANGRSPLQKGIRLYDIFGQNCDLTPTLSTSGEGVKIDVSGLAPGMYFVRIGDKVGKFVKI